MDLVLSKFQERQERYANRLYQQITHDYGKSQKQDRISLVELKSIVERPDLVQPDDCNAEDPLGLVLLRNMPDQVDIPQHWRQNKGRARFPSSGAGDLPLPEEYTYAIKQYCMQRPQGFTSLAAMARDEQMEKSKQPVIGPENVQWRQQEYSHYGIPLDVDKLPSAAHRFTRGIISQELKEALGYNEGDEYIWDVRMRNLNLKPIDLP